MRAKEAIEIAGGLREVSQFAERIAKTNEVEVEVCPHQNEEDPTDEFCDFLNVLFYYKPDRYEGFCQANRAIAAWLSKKGLALSYECSGDGEGGRIIMSYRVIAA